LVDKTEEDEALALLCAYLGDLREKAKAGLWSNRLDRVVRNVREGGSAMEACRRLGLAADDDSTTRSGDTGLWRVPGLSTAALPMGKGRYTCPRAVCQRKAGRDADGHPPRCELFERPMQPR
jgi:hypothetical protein